MERLRLQSAGPPPPNALYAARAERLARGAPVTDLTAGNPTEHGRGFPAGTLSEILGRAAAAASIYRPDPLGLPAAREAVSAWYGARGLEFPAERILLTPGTSLSYFYAMSLLAAPGDEFLCPRPSYPLFETIAGLCGVALATYPLREENAWAFDPEEIEAQVSTRTRAVVVISPHNPTGAVASREALDGVAQVARRHGLALIHDEVFSEFLRGGQALPRPAGDAPLQLTLNGVSKMFALPGLKVGWIAAGGETSRAARFMAGLEHLSDTFLPVNDAAQHALPEIFRAGADFLPGLQAWLEERRAQALEIVGRSPALRCVPPAGGFHLALRLAGGAADEEAFAVELLREHGVLVHPGHFYELPAPHVALTFVHGRESLGLALERLAELAGRGRESEP